MKAVPGTPELSSIDFSEVPLFFSSVKEPHHYLLERPWVSRLTFTCARCALFSGLLSPREKFFFTLVSAFPHTIAGAGSGRGSF